jgi:hypothetical protein
MVRLHIPDTLLERRIPMDENQSPNQDLSRQTVYDDYNDYDDYDQPRAQGLWTIEVAIDRSSSNDPSSLSN